VTSRRRTILGLGAALVVLALSALWFAARETGNAARFRRPSRIFPTTWPPAVRGALWLVAGAVAVAFDLYVVRAGAETQRGRDAAAAFAVVTGVAFTAFAIIQFANAF
jgi:hypothetical protein